MFRINPIHSARIIFIWLIPFILCLSLTARAASGTDYTVINLSPGGSHGWVFQNGINSSGQVAGTYTTPSLYGHGFFFDGNTSQDLGTLGGNNSAANATNNNGQVAGYSQTSIGQDHAFLWSETSGLIDLGTLGGSSSYALAINDMAQVTGYSQTASGQFHAFMWTATGGMIDLGTLGGNSSYAQAINKTGQIIGYSKTASGQDHAFSWTSSGGMQDLGALGGSSSYAQAVNTQGQVVGWYLNTSGLQRAFLWSSASGMVDLGTLGGNTSVAYDINDMSQIVGGSTNSLTLSATEKAFSWSASGGMFDLTPLYASSYAQANNSYNQVIGTANSNVSNVSIPFLWTGTGGAINLNDHIVNKPAGMYLYSTLAISDNGDIAAISNAGLVLLRGGATKLVIGPISANDPVATGTPLSSNASYTDADTAEIVSANWTWGDGSAVQAGIVSGTVGSGVISGNHTFLTAGIYPISLQVTDNSGQVAQVSQDVVIYDPSAGFVTGTGWFNSPPGALKNDPSLIGRATFGFVSKYQKGAKTPTGTTDFEFQTANLKFHSENYQWLVISGARAQYKGTGTINGLGSYNFLLTAIDGQLPGGGGQDRFRIKIWYYDSSLQQDIVVYDNQINASDIGTIYEGTQLGGGSIVIHS